MWASIFNQFWVRLWGPFWLHFGFPFWAYGQLPVDSSHFPSSWPALGRLGAGFGPILVSILGLFFVRCGGPCFKGLGLDKEGTP